MNTAGRWVLGALLAMALTEVAAAAAGNRVWLALVISVLLGYILLLVRLSGRRRR